MTVVAWDGRTLACDGMVSDGEGHIHLNDCQKILTFTGAQGKAGILACGFAGEYMEGAAMAHWVASGCKMRSPPELTGEASELIAIDTRGVVWYMNGWGLFEEFPVQQVAIGSGRTYAMGAMAAGADAVRAVQHTARFNTLTGGVGTSWDFETRGEARFNCYADPVVRRSPGHLRRVK